MFNYLFLTNQIDIANYVEQHGVTRIFLDLEKMGKLDRQGHLDTVISNNSLSDIEPLKKSLKIAKLLVRLNPLHKNTKDEIQAAIDSGADLIMQPMISSIDEVECFGNLINGRAKFIPLVETLASANCIEQIQNLECVDELFIGLNDLHLDMNLKFMFELFTNGMIEQMIEKLKKPYGIGGVAQIGSGNIPGELIISEHVRLKSTGVILSRSFHQNAKSVNTLENTIKFSNALAQLEKERINCINSTQEELNTRHLLLIDKVNKFLNHA